MTRMLPFPRMQILKEYIRSVQIAYGPRPYFIRCVPKFPTPEYRKYELKGTITEKVTNLRMIGSPPMYYFSYTYTISCEDGSYRTYTTMSGRFDVNDKVILELINDKVVAMRKEGETTIESVLLNRPKILTNLRGVIS